MTSELSSCTPRDVSPPGSYRTVNEWCASTPPPPPTPTTPPYKQQPDGGKAPPPQLATPKEPPAPAQAITRGSGPPPTKAPPTSGADAAPTPPKPVPGTIKPPPPVPAEVAKGDRRLSRVTPTRRVPVPLPTGEKLLFLLLFGLLLVGVTAWLYRREGAASGLQKTLLALLRVSVIIATLLVFCQPRLVADKEKTIASVTLLLIDISQAAAVRETTLGGLLPDRFER